MITPPRRTALGTLPATGCSTIRAPGLALGLFAGALWLGGVGACGDPTTHPGNTGTLAGVVRDAATDAAIEGVTIIAAGRESETGSDGGFEIGGVPAGIHQVTATIHGYVAQSVEAEIQAGVTTSLDLELVPTPGPGPSPLAVTTSLLPSGTVDVPYQASLEATGGTPPYVWLASHPPPGLAVTSNGFVTGTPGFPAGAHTFVVSVHDANSAVVSADVLLTIETSSGLRAVGEQLSTGEAGVPYADTVRGEGGAPPYTFELAGLPEGLELDPQTGVVSGTPHRATGLHGEPIDLEVLVRDAVGASAFAPITIGIAPAPLVIASDLPDGQVGVHYEATLGHTGGFGTFGTFTVISGSLPPGLDIAGGPESLFGSRLVGTPSLAGTYQFTLQLSLCDTNRPGECIPQIATREYVLAISGSPLSIITSSLPDADVGTPYSIFLVREGGTGPFQWDIVSGSLPAGISLTAAGELTGTPTDPEDASFEVRVRDAGGQSATTTLFLHVEP